MFRRYEASAYVRATPSMHIDELIKSPPPAANNSASTYSDDSWYVDSSHEVTDLAAYCRYVKTTKDGLHLASTRQNTCGLLVLQLHHHSPRSWRDTLEGRTHATKLTSAHSRSSEPMPIYTFIRNHGPTMHRFRN